MLPVLQVQEEPMLPAAVGLICVQRFYEIGWVCACP